MYPPDTKPIGTMVPKTLDEQEFGVGLGYHLRMGSRNDQEDVVDVHLSSEKSQVYAGVYDGHQGVEVASYLKQHLRNEILTRIQEKGISPRQAFADSFEKVDTDIRNSAHGESTGSCAVVATIAGDALLCANVGDCEGCLSKNGYAYNLTTKHNCSNIAEVERVRNEGGKVVDFAGGLRVAAVLAVTRTFGDASTKSHSTGRGLSAVPDVTVVELDGTEEFLILGSDGLFDKFPSKQELINVTKRLLRETGDVDEAAEKLVDMTVDERKSRDNTSVVIILLNQGVITGETNIMDKEAGYASNHKPIDLSDRKVNHARQKFEEEAIQSYRSDSRNQMSELFNQGAGEVQPTSSPPVQEERPANHDEKEETTNQYMWGGPTAGDANDVSMSLDGEAAGSFHFMHSNVAAVS